MDKNDKRKSQSAKLKTEEEKLDAKKIEEELKRKVEELEDKYRRALADYQNLEKRAMEDRKEWVRKANKNLLLRLLPVLDTLMLATQHSKDEGVRLSCQQFLDILKLEGVEKIETQDKKFDPYLMECIDAKEGEKGKVLEEVRAGYKLFDQVLRVAEVIVGKQ